MAVPSILRMPGKIPSGVRRILAPLAFLLRWGRGPVEQIHTKKQALSAEKQAELELLCQELFKKKELISSGKLQFIGLSKIKARMGKKWKGLAQIVYDTAEEVIDKYMEKGDLFIRYRDDTYIIVFAQAVKEESQLKATLIAEEIRRRLFELDEEELRALEVRQAVSEIRTDMLMEAGGLDDVFGKINNSFDVWEDENKDNARVSKRDSAICAVPVSSVDVGTDRYRKKRTGRKKWKDMIPEITCSFLPLWDTHYGALTTYLCLAREADDDASILLCHKKLYAGRTTEEKEALDHVMLDKVASELAGMARRGKKFYLVCPVQHETLFTYESYELYKKHLSRIPEAYRKYMMLLVMNMEQGTPPKKAYWFAKPLRAMCPYIMAEVPLRRDVNFHYLAEAGVNVAGVRLDHSDLSEQEIINLLSGFSSKAKSHKIPKTFLLGVKSLSITTSAVCAGYDYLGGKAIHTCVQHPDTVHRYQYEDLLTGLRQ